LLLNHRLARSIANATWGKAVSILSYKAERAGKGIFVLGKEETMYTTQECSNCGCIKRGGDRLALKDRTYNCCICGLSMDRDVNAAKVVLKRATLGQRGSNARGNPVNTMQHALQTGSLNREHTDGSEIINPEGSLGF